MEGLDKSVGMRGEWRELEFLNFFAAGGLASEGEVELGNLNRLLDFDFPPGGDVRSLEEGDFGSP